MEWFNNRSLFLTVREAGKSEIKVPASQFLMRALFLAFRWLPPPCVLTWLFLNVCTQAVDHPLVSLLIRVLLISRKLHFMTFSILITSEGLIAKCHPTGSLDTYIFGVGHKYRVCNTRRAHSLRIYSDDPDFFMSASLAFNIHADL